MSDAELAKAIVAMTDDMAIDQAVAGVGMAATAVLRRATDGGADPQLVPAWLATLRLALVRR